MNTVEDKRGRLRRWWRPWVGGPTILSTTFSQPLGANAEAGELAGYYIDMRVKAVHSHWPPHWFNGEGSTYWVAVAQYGLGCHERFLTGEGDRWGAAAIEAGKALVEAQVPDGPNQGAWLHRFDYPHTYKLPNPWTSAIVQGEAASLLVRLARETSEDRFGEAAVAALLPMKRPREAGGLAAELGGDYFPEEYPTDPPSLVLNGGIFGIWGLHDVDLAYPDSSTRGLFDSAIRALEANLHRYDTGYWSRYDLFPHRMTNVASSAYHELHIAQLRASATLTGSRVLTEYADRFQAYERSRTKAARAFAHKVAFRLAIPRNRVLANRGRSQSPPGLRAAEAANSRS